MSLGAFFVCFLTLTGRYDVVPETQLCVYTETLRNATETIVCVCYDNKGGIVSARVRCCAVAVVKV